MHQFLEALERRELLTATVLTDINRIPEVSSFPRDIHQIGEFAVFVADSEFGTEVWHTDGTPEGTRLLKDITPGPDSTSFIGFLRTDSFLYFVTDTDPLSSHRRSEALWRTDGTSEGTVRLGKTNPQLVGNMSFPQDSFALGDLLLSIGGRLVSDGTVEGTHLLQEIGRKTEATAYTVGDRFLIRLSTGGQFWVNPDGSASPLDFQVPSAVRQLKMDALIYRTRNDSFRIFDGTPEGSFEVEKQGLRMSQFQDSFEVSDAIVTSWQRSGQAEIRRFTPGNFETELVTTFPEKRITDFTSFDDYQWFITIDSLGHQELWRTDGTVAGTLEVAGLGIHDDFANATLVVAGDHLYAVGHDAEVGNELRSVTLGDHELQLVADIEPGEIGSNPHTLGELDGRLFFRATTLEHGEATWVTDGTPLGTIRMADLHPGLSNPSLTVPVEAGDVYVFAAESDGEVELWRTNLTPDGTGLLRDIKSNKTRPSQPSQLVAYKDHLYFTADDGLHGIELWRTDGSSTTLVQDLYPGSLSSQPADIRVVDDLLYLDANWDESRRGVWRTDGTQFERVDGNNSVGRPTLQLDQYEYWIDDGVWRQRIGDQDSRQLVYQRNPVIESLVEQQGVLLLTERSEGDSPYFRLREIDPTSLKVRTLGFIPIYQHGPIFATTNDVFLWVNLGTENILRRYSNGETSRMSLPLFPNELRTIAPGVIMISNGEQHLLTDGTPEGTFETPRRILMAQSFAATSIVLSEDDDQLRLHVGDSRLRHLRPLRTFPKSTLLDAIAGPDFMVFLLTSESDPGPQIWYSNGTVDGTKLLADLRPDIAPFATVESLVLLNNHAFFVSDHHRFGEELWSVPLPQSRADVNGDGLISAQDVDRLYEAIRSNDTNELLDLNGDQLTNELDVSFLVEDILGTQFGDANLDGHVNFDDFASLSSHFGEAGSWDSGDFNGDGEVNFIDFVHLSINFGS